MSINDLTISRDNMKISFVSNDADSQIFESNYKFKI